jgi:hypothetical protein
MGFAQKDPSQRVNRVKPVTEWVDLEPLEAPLLPPYPMHWYRDDLRLFVVPKWMWDLWRQDPVTAQWSPGDLALILDLGEHFYAIKQADRLRTLTVLGLNAAGRRNLRLRIPVESQRYEEAERQAAEVRRLRIVDNRQAS